MIGLDQLPGPKALPLIGNLHQFDRKNIHKLLERWSDLHGPISKFRLGPKTIVVVSRAELVQEILRGRPENFRRMSSIEAVFEEIAHIGLFSAEGESWKRQRKLTAPSFHTAHLKQFFETLTIITRRLKKRWGASTLRGQDISICKDFTRYTVDVTTSLAFGHDMNTLEGEDDVIQKHLEHFFPAIGRRVNALFPYWRYLKLPADRALDRSIREVRKEVGKIVQSTREMLKKTPDLAPRNYLEALLSSVDDAGSTLTDDEIFGNILTILLAGEDTTANALAWLVYFLSSRPDVQDKMQEEADRVLGSSELPEKFEDASALPYIEAVILESMRLKPVTPFLFLESLQETQIGELKIPGGTSVITLMSNDARNDENFSEANAFHPHRWLSEQRPAEWRHNLKAFMPFGGGPRVCPGRSLALLEMKMVVAMLARNFSVKPPRNGKTPTEEFTFAVVPVDLWARLEFRDARASAAFIQN